MKLTIPPQLFVTIRKLIFPFSKIEGYVPNKGKILDVGCGHGFFSIMLAKKSSARTITAIDPSKIKISQAKNLAGKTRNIKFQVGYLNNLKDRNFDAVVIVDVAFLMPTQDKLKLLKDARKRLKKNGKLIFKEVEKTKSLFYHFMLFEEFLMARVFKLTFTNHNQTYLMTRREYVRLLKQAGFKIIKIVDVRGPLPYPHILIVARS